MKISALLSLTLTLLLPTAHALDGWRTERQPDALVYVPAELPAGKTFRITVRGPLHPTDGPTKRWFLDTIKRQQAALGKPRKSWNVQEKRGRHWHTANVYTGPGGQPMIVGYVGTRQPDGRVYIGQMVSTSDQQVFGKYGTRFLKVMDDAKRKLPSTQSARRTSGSSAATPVKAGLAPTGAIPRPKPPRGFKEFQGIVYYGIQPGGMFGPTSKTIALFKDHTYTDDIATVFKQGVAASKRSNPKDWGQWRQRGKKLELKSHGNAKFKKTQGDWRAAPGRPGQKLHGCFGRLVSSSGVGTGTSTVGRASSWCFWPNGRFTHNATGFVMAYDPATRGETATGGARGAAYSTPPTERGRYRIEGYTMRLVYDDGSSTQAGFAFLDDAQSHIAINGTRFMGDEKK